MWTPVNLVIKLVKKTLEIKYKLNQNQAHMSNLNYNKMLDWETREQYLDLLEKLISEKINSFQFYIEFKERNYFNS